LIFAYNPANVGDVLMVITADDKNMEQTYERKENVVRIKTIDGSVVGWNIFAISAILTLKEEGQLQLTQEQVEKINQEICQAGFDDRLQVDQEPKFVIGYVKSCQAHKDSDHLSITQVEIDNGQSLQIVCGAPNIRNDLKVVVAKPGAMMPDGMLIWPGELRGVASYGMICSARELQLPDAPQKPGILELASDAVVGQEFIVSK